MSIYEEKRSGKPTGKLVVEVKLADRIVKRRVATMKEAKLLEAQLRAGLADTTARGAGTYTLGKLVDDCKSLWRGTKDEANSYRRLGRICEALGTPSKTLNSLTALDIDRAQEELRKEGLSDATLNRYSAVLIKALKWAQKRDLLMKIPEVRWYQEPLKKFSWVTTEDEKRILEWLREPGNVRGGLGGSTRSDLGERIAVIVRTLVITGMRVGELLAAKPEHIDPEAETVTLWDTKSGDSRTQHLPRDLAETLKAMKTQGQCPSYPSIHGVFTRAKEALKLDPDLTIHGLRHTTATRLVMAGVNHRVVMEYMGHKSVETTNRYAHVNAEAKRTAAKVLLGEV